MSDYSSLLTTVGQNVLTAAQANHTTVNLSSIAIGDGGGAQVTVNESMTSLMHEVWRGAINQIFVDPNNANWLVIEGLVPGDVGGWFAREVGIFDESGNLIVVAPYPETYKPILTDGTLRELLIHIILETGNVDQVSLSLDPSIILASRGWVQHQLDEHANSQVAHAYLFSQTAEAEKAILTGENGKLPHLCIPGIYSEYSRLYYGGESNDPAMHKGKLTVYRNIAAVRVNNNSLFPGSHIHVLFENTNTAGWFECQMQMHGNYGLVTVSWQTAGTALFGWDYTGKYAPELYFSSTSRVVVKFPIQKIGNYGSYADSYSFDLFSPGQPSVTSSSNPKRHPHPDDLSLSIRSTDI